MKRGLAMRLGAGVFLGLLFLGLRDTAAHIAFEKIQSPTAALYLAVFDSDLLMHLGSYYFGGGTYDLSKAEKAYKKALFFNKGKLWGHYQLARIYFVEGKLPEAFSEVNAELKYNPSNQRSFYVRALIYAYRNEDGDLARSEADFRRFVAWAPSEWAGYNDLGWILAREGKFADSKKIIEDAFATVSNGKENPWLWNTLGAVYLNQKNMKEARAAFTAALSLSQKLSPEAFQKAYPGDNPNSSFSGLQAFVETIKKNLEKTK